ERGAGCPASEVRQGLGLLVRQRHPRRVERVERHDPWAEAGAEGLAEERAEWLVLPGLDVPRAPVVQQADAEDVIGEVVDRHPLAQFRWYTDDVRHLGLDVEAGAWPEGRPVGSGLAALTQRAYDVGAGQDE